MAERWWPEMSGTGKNITWEWHRIETPTRAACGATLCTYGTDTAPPKVARLMQTTKRPDDTIVDVCEACTSIAPVTHENINSKTGEVECHDGDYEFCGECRSQRLADAVKDTEDAGVPMPRTRAALELVVVGEYYNGDDPRPAKMNFFRPSTPIPGFVSSGKSNLISSDELIDAMSDDDEDMMRPTWADKADSASEVLLSIVLAAALGWVAYLLCGHYVTNASTLITVAYIALGGMLGRVLAIEIHTLLWKVIGR